MSNQPLLQHAESVAVRDGRGVLASSHMLDERPLQPRIDLAGAEILGEDDAGGVHETIIPSFLKFYATDVVEQAS